MSYVRTGSSVLCKRKHASGLGYVIELGFDGAVHDENIGIYREEKRDMIVTTFGK